MTRRPVPAILFCLVVLASCASSGPGVSSARPSATASLLEISSWQPPAGQTCDVGPVDSLPRFAAVFDSAALANRARSIGSPGALLLSIGTDSLGVPSRYHHIDTTLPPAEAEALEATVLEHFRGGAAFRARVRVDIDPGNEPRFALGALQLCPPVLSNREEISRYMEDANQRATRSGRVILRVFVQEDGSVTRAHVVEESGHAYLDAVSVGIATQMRFHPALVDRQPVPVWIQVPFALQMRR